MNTLMIIIAMKPLKYGAQVRRGGGQNEERAKPL